MPYFIAVLIIAFGISGSAAAESNRPIPGGGIVKGPQPHGHADGIQQQPSADERGTQDAPLIVKVLPTPKTDEEAAQDKADREDVSSANWWMVRLTGLIGIIGVIQAGVFWVQAGRLKETIDKMDEIAKSQANDTQATIAAATRSASAMENVAVSIAANVETSRTIAQTQREFWERQMRAYVLTETCILWDGTTLDQPQPNRKNVPGAVVISKNSGLTPAYGVVSWAQIDVIDVKNESLLTVPTLQSVFRTTVAPHGTFTKAIWFHRPMTDHEISDIQTGVRAIYVYGRIEYVDVLKQPRYSNFRLRYTGQWPPPKGHNLGFSETEGNDAN